MNEPFVVTKIPFKQTRLVDENNNYYSNVNVFDAKKRAESIGLQLVCFSTPQDNTQALCKIIDYGKWRYSNEKAQKKLRADQKHGVKDVRISARTEEGDLKHKLRHVVEFIEDGNDVIIEMVIEGRDLEHMDLANAKMDDVISRLDGKAKIVSRKVVEGKKKQIVVRLCRMK